MNRKWSTLLYCQPSSDVFSVWSRVEALRIDCRLQPLQSDLDPNVRTVVSRRFRPPERLRYCLGWDRLLVFRRSRRLRSPCRNIRFRSVSVALAVCDGHPRTPGSSRELSSSSSSSPVLSVIDVWTVNTYTPQLQVGQLLSNARVNFNQPKLKPTVWLLHRNNIYICVVHVTPLYPTFLFSPFSCRLY